MSRRVVETTVMLAVFGMLVGCSGSDGKKAYTVPAELCGVSVDPDLISPFLPSGKEVGVRGTHPVPGRRLCRVDVDGKWALTANQEWWEENVSIATVASGNPQLGSAEMSDDGTSLYSGTGAVTRIKDCHNPDHSQHVLYTSFGVRASDLADTAAMKKLAAAYTKAVEKSDECS
ncbi:hypothetical protein ABZ471_03030 [Streptomyces sp. NPDC005728]|uniref:hypothetical protein n=1 Tax=Streptomyces sp. NPDC005728 TaxID=3157054 RepID=UPI003401BBB5